MITRLGAALLLIAAALPFVAAGKCQIDEFWFSKKNCCLPVGGPSWSPPPPSGKKCPSSDWSWSDDQGCCTPHHPRPPPPKCPSDWDWDEPDLCCKKRPKPSYYRRAPAKRDLTAPCPLGLSACPIAGLSGLTTEFECLDTTNELESCGGCASIGKGDDCTAIKGAWNVGCERGRCAVHTCAAGYKHSRDRKFCVPN